MSSLPTRRQAIGSLLIAAAAARARPAFAAPLVSARPKRERRKFVSDGVEATIVAVKKDIADEELAWLFENCFPNTLDTTVRTGQRDGKPDAFVVTGDIQAMWLRDSSAQVWPYLPLTKDDHKLRALVAGVINRQARCILIDPYANAFNDGPKGGPWQKDHTAMKPDLHERKWEIDSLCYPIRLAHGYWQATGDASLFDATWARAMALVVSTFIEQQRRKDRGPYSFQRTTPVPTDTLPLGGYGNPTRPCGLIHSGFRPSDDACQYPFLIPANLFAVTSLRQLAEILTATSRDQTLAARARTLADEVEGVVKTMAVLPHRGDSILAYEVDGFGNALFMDDANVPSLLSLPYLGCIKPTDELYRHTRAFALGPDNPYFFRGRAAEGIGGPHVGLDMIWPLAVIMRAMTTTDGGEIRGCLRTLKASSAGTGLMHESFHKHDPKHFTRPWFAWANTLFGELVLRLHKDRPDILKEQI